MSTIISKYAEYLEEKINEVYDTLNNASTDPITGNGIEALLPEGYTFKVVQEVSFGSESDNENTIIIVLKTMTGTIMATSVVYPLQMMIYAEANGVEVARTVLDKFATTYSMSSFSRDLTYYKQQYTTTVMMTPLNPGPEGFRAFLYISGTIVVTDQIQDVAYLKIGTLKVPFNNLTISYSAQPDTQRIEGQELNQSIKSTATIMISFDCVNSIGIFFTQLKDLRTGVTSNGTTGNTRYTVTLYKVDDSVYETYDMLIINTSSIYVPGDLPRIQVSMIK